MGKIPSTPPKHQFYFKAPDSPKVARPHSVKNYYPHSSSEVSVPDDEQNVFSQFRKHLFVDESSINTSSHQITDTAMSSSRSSSCSGHPLKPGPHRASLTPAITKFRLSNDLIKTRIRISAHIPNILHIVYSVQGSYLYGTKLPPIFWTSHFLPAQRFR
jgi:hypothetical protein